MKNKSAQEIKAILIKDLNEYNKHLNNHNKNTLLEHLKSAIVHSQDVEGYKSVQEWKEIKKNYFKEYLLDGEEGFKPSKWVGSWRASYYYYISNLGRALVVDIKNIAAYHNNDKKEILTFKKDGNKNNCLVVSKNCWFIAIENGHFVKKIINCPFDYLNASSSTWVYTYVDDAQWPINKDEDYKKKMLEYSQNKQIAIHHINGNPTDNRIDNLIYLPNAIHKELNGINYIGDRYDPIM